MDRLPPHARALLEQARDAHDPTPRQRESADTAARAELAQFGIRDLPQLGAADPARVAPPEPRFPPGLLRAVTPLRLGLTTLAAAAALGALALYGSRAEHSEPAAARAPLNEPDRALTDPSPTPNAIHQPAERELAVEPARQPSPEPLRAQKPRASGGSRGRATADAESLAAELRFIATVDAHVRGRDFEAALRLLESEANVAPRAKLREERRALRVLALCGSGPTAQALREREQFLRAAPKSLLATRVRAACAGQLP